MKQEKEHMRQPTLLFVGKRASETSLGVQKKLDEQIRGWQQLGFAVDYTVTGAEGAQLIQADGMVHEIHYETSQSRSVWQRASDNLRLPEEILRFAARSGRGYALCYLRKPVLSQYHIQSLRLLREHFGCAVVEEFPTFPYYDEMTEAIRRKKTYYALRSYLSDRLAAKKLCGVVDLIADYGERSSIFGVPTVSIENGIEVERYPLRQFAPSSDNGLHLISVSTMKSWHGYDRLIRGLSTYYRNSHSERVVFHVVGDGPCRAEWERLSQSLGLKDKVVFHGTLSGAPLDQVFAQCQLAVCSLAEHRKGLYQDSALKNREYLARGIPVLYSAEDSLLSGAPKYCLQLPQDDSPIDIASVVAFAETLCDELETAAQFLRGYTARRCLWRGQFEKVLRVLRGMKHNR